MSFDRPDDPHSRGTTLARLLTEALNAQTNSGGVQNSACPEAELLAAYADQGLAEEETARWERHFAHCNRCQKIIAVLAASDEELTEAEVQGLGRLAAASSVARPPIMRSTATPWMTIWQRPVFWRWLVAAVGMASAAALWLALRPGPPHQLLSSRKIAAPTEAAHSEVAPGGPTASSAKPDGNQIAQANLPGPPMASPSSRAQLRDKEKAPANSSVTTQEEAVHKQVSSHLERQLPPSSEANADSLPSREESIKDGKALSAQAAQQTSETRNALAAAAPARPTAEPSTPPSAGYKEPAARSDFDTATGAAAPAQRKALDQRASLATMFASPDRRALWRLGLGGRIEHSVDQGRTWQQQASGVTADLLAGAAPSEKIAWAVGQAGVILRTEDGEHWQRVAPPPTEAAAPPSPLPDWIGVEARDELHATIISRDLRRFVTKDAGRRWSKQP
jgi:hypothetical protein